MLINSPKKVMRIETAKQKSKDDPHRYKWTLEEKMAEPFANDIPIWLDTSDGGVLQDEPIDHEINKTSQLIRELQTIDEQAKNIANISNLAFDAADTDMSNDLDNIELLQILKRVALDLGLTVPTEDDVISAMKELDENQDGTVDKNEFAKIIQLCFRSMLCSEYEFQDYIDNRKDEEGNCIRDLKMQENLKSIIATNLANIQSEKEADKISKAYDYVSSSKKVN